MPNNDSVKVMSPSDCEHILEEVRSCSADYSYIWSACREAAQFDIAFNDLRKTVDPDRPYFFGKIANGIHFAGDARDLPSAFHAIYPTCNAPLIEALILSIGDRPGDFLDVGSNIGVVAASLARHLTGQGHVHAFEPSPSTCKLAAATLALNGLRNFSLAETAVGNEDGQILFNATHGNSAISSVYKHGFSRLNEWNEIVVSCRKLDTLFENCSSIISMLKIDVEGYELNVMEGARKLIASKRPITVFEYTPAAIEILKKSEHDFITALNVLQPCVFEALAEQTVSNPNCAPNKISFPLPVGFDTQVNVFARPI